MNILILSILLLLTTVNCFPKFYSENNRERSCGYSSCPTTDPDVLNVHLVPHSHDDVGWLKTVDQYYYGSRSNIQKAGVQYILDSVIQALLQNPERRFIYVETAFLWKWWQEQNDEMHEIVRELVNTGRLEIIGGAWSMNDEAAAHYTSTIDQFTWGFRKLNDTLGECARPKIGWQIDPFGHSREQASIFAQLGFDGLFFARLDWRDKSNLLDTKSAEMLWQGSQSLGKSSQLFTSVLYNHYSAPPGFCFDILCDDTPIVENKKSPEYNAEKRAEEFLKFVETQAKYYKTNNVIVTMGGDFNYQDAHMYFINMDKLIKVANSLQSKTKLVYSTPSCYLKAVHESNLDWPVKTDDFFPYASDPHTYWNGYFTSRPTSKRFERLGNNFLQITKQLASLTVPKNSENGLDPLREAIGIMQHHDAITGTEKQHVAEDYHRIVTEGIVEAEKVANINLQNLSAANVTFESCLLLNISQCSITENNENVSITVYNPLSRNISHYVRVPVSHENYVVFYDGSQITSQIVPIFERIANIPGRESSATHEVVFRADDIPPLGFKVYNLTQSSFKSSISSEFIPNKNIKLNFDKNGRIKSIRRNGRDIDVRQEYAYYLGAAGDNMEFKNRSSGAYIFRPNSSIPLDAATNISKKEYYGPLVTEYHEIYNDWISHIIRIYHDALHFEFQWIIGPIPVEDGIGKEVIIRINTSLNSGDVFYTDSNGREMLRRVRGYRETYNLTHEEPVSENYYPVTSKITIQDDVTNERLSLLNDRAQGGASLDNGVVELMLHRRLLRDDAFGVGEALNEQAFGTGLVATGKLFMTAGSVSGADSVIPREKELAQKLLSEPWIFVTSGNGKIPVNKFTGLKKDLPPNVQILTLEPWFENKILLRLEHIYEKDEDSTYSVPVDVDIQDLFSTFIVWNVEEMALGANQLKSEVNRLQWTAESEYKDEHQYEGSLNKETQRDSTVTLNPMEIRTFILTVQPNLN